MKIMVRTLIILLAALVVTAGLLAFSSSSMAAGLRGDLPGRDGFERGAVPNGASITVSGAISNGGSTGHDLTLNAGLAGDVTLQTGK